MRRNEKFVSYIEAELRQRDISVRGLARLTGIANSTISRWLNGHGDPSDDNIQALADSFDIEAKQIYELLGRVEPTRIVELDDRERWIIESYRSLPTIAEKQRFLRLAEAFSSYDSGDKGQETNPAPTNS